ncbi:MULTISPECIES: helical backbone metal receptor [unclassified Acidovorax]|uniref:ABC transporter substrate-binding protein n=1 Tax=unclassified Acidovorax TaxID=2684926 RepID=UPI002883346E|nr:MULTISPECIES: helical backbone metal receptor [unclassified Acidovorax]
MPAAHRSSLSRSRFSVPLPPPAPRLNRGRVWAPALLTCLLMAAGMARGGPIRIADDRQQTLELPRPALRIVSLQPSLTETVCALGACDRLVGVDRHSNWPAAVRQLPQVGSLAEANIERIVALKPDLVLLRPRNRVAERLEALGIKVLALDARTHADMRRHMELVAQAIGQPGAGEALWRRTDAALDAAKARVPAAWKGRRVYFELHGGAAAASEASFIGETLTRLGLRNVVPAQLGLYPKLGPEYVVRADPDLLITHAGRGAPPPAARPGWGAIPALRAGRLCRIGETHFDVLVRAGPRIDEAAMEILACLESVDRRAHLE